MHEIVHSLQRVTSRVSVVADTPFNHDSTRTLFAEDAVGIDTGTLASESHDQESS